MRDTLCVFQMNMVMSNKGVVAETVVCKALQVCTLTSDTSNVLEV